MIAAWMIYTMAVALLIYAAAAGTEYVARAFRLPTRFVWLVAILVAVGLSASALAGGRRAPHAAAPTLTRARATGANVDVALDTADLSVGAPATESAVARFRTVARSAVGSLARMDTRSFDRWNVLLIVAWFASSVLGMAWLLVSLVRLRRLARRLVTETVANHPVLISENVGPALLGILRPQIVLPKWVLELPATEHAIIVAHERQHAAAFDPALVCASICIVALQPWNAALWILLARLRLAVEVDCDGRVLGAGAAGAVHRYGRLLVAMYERRSGLSTQLAFATRPSNLELRIRRITSRPRIYTVAFGASAIVAMVCATAAWETAAPKRAAALTSNSLGASAEISSVLAAGLRTTPIRVRPTAPSPVAAATRPLPGKPAGESIDTPRVARVADSVGAHSPSAGSTEQRVSEQEGVCATPDSVAIRGLSRIQDADVRSVLGIAPKSTINAPVLKRALTNLDATHQFEPNASAQCEVISGKAVLVFNVTERSVRAPQGEAPPRIIGQLNSVPPLGPMSTEAMFEMLFEGIPLDKGRADRAMAMLDSLQASQAAQMADVTRRVQETRPQRQLLQAQLDSTLLAVPTNAADVETVRSRLPQTPDGVGRGGGGGRGTAAGTGPANVGGGRGGGRGTAGDAVDLLYSRFFDGITLSSGQEAAARAAIVTWQEGTRALLPRLEPRILNLRRNPTLIVMQAASDSAFLALVSSDADRATLQSRISVPLPPPRPPN